MRPIRSGNVNSPQAKRVQPSNSKGGNWWQSPFYGAHTEKSAENSKARQSRYEENASSEGMEMERIARWAKRVQPSNSKGGNWWQSPFCGAHT
jgi:hypothetical protein